jgi:hypothetical protein
MTAVEMLNEFSIKYNNIMSNQAPGLNSYEISVFLTRAQEELVKNYFNPNGNKYRAGFDGNEKRQIDFSMLIKAVKLTTYTSADYIKIDPRSQLYDFSTVTNLLFVINETATVMNDTTQVKRINIRPLSYIEYSRLMLKPYKAPLNYEGWRLMNKSTDNTKSIAEVILSLNSGETLFNYIIRYVMKPTPIVVANLNEEYSDVSVDGVTELTDCKLDPEIHSEIVQRAVEIAKASYGGSESDLVSMGTRTE